MIQNLIGINICIIFFIFILIISELFYYHQNQLIFQIRLISVLFQQHMFLFFKLYNFSYPYFLEVLINPKLIIYLFMITLIILILILNAFLLTKIINFFIDLLFFISFLLNCCFSIFSLK